MEKQISNRISILALSAFMVFFAALPQAKAQQKDFPEVTMLTAVPNFAFAAIWDFFHNFPGFGQD